MMDVIFDIDGTLANASHRLHLIETKGAKNWEAFLSEEMVAQDTPIPETWRVLTALVESEHARVIFITGRAEAKRQATWDWLMNTQCPIRCIPVFYWSERRVKQPVLYMRKDGDNRSSDVVKEESLYRARSDGFAPTLVFEDRTSDTIMWRRNGLLCCQVAKGDF